MNIRAASLDPTAPRASKGERQSPTAAQLAYYKGKTVAFATGVALNVTAVCLAARNAGYGTLIVRATIRSLNGIKELRVGVSLQANLPQYPG